MSDDQFVIGCIARLEPHKAIDDLLHAFSMSGDSDWRLIIVGEGPEREKLQQLTKCLELESQTRWLGYVDDVDIVIPAFDVFALPSQLEGLGLVYIEAAFHGVPSVAADVGGVPEAVIDEETGLLVPVNDPKVLGDALRRMTSDSLRRRLGEAASRRANSEFTDEVMGAAFELLLSGTNGRAD